MNTHTCPPSARIRFPHLGRLQALRRFTRSLRTGATGALLIAGASLAEAANANTIVIRTDSLGSTPAASGLNLGHFANGSNAAEFWRYLGASGARVFISPSMVEPGDDIEGTGDGVVTRDDFFARRDAMDANVLNPDYINWPYFENNYATRDSLAWNGEGNMLTVDGALQALHDQGATIMATISATEGRFPITNSDDWAGKWELWQHYYAQAFYLARKYDVVRFSMFNEPNHEAAGGITSENWRMRLELASDAIQRAIANVNARDAKSLVPTIFAPNTAGNPLGDAWTFWGQPAIHYRHRKINGFNYSNWNNLHYYNYQFYAKLSDGTADPIMSGVSFGTTLATMHTRIAGEMPGETPYPVAVTEANSLTASDFFTTADTLETPSRFVTLGSILSNLVNNAVREVYVFKMAQTKDAEHPITPVKKNGLCYTDNTTFRYGGITLAGEVMRLVYKAVEPGRERPNWERGTGLDGVDITVVRDANAARHWVLLVNTNQSSRNVFVNTSALGNLQDNRVIVEEVSSSHAGAVAKYTRVNNHVIQCGQMPKQSVWLVTIPTAPQQMISSGIPTLSVAASADAMVKDGTNKFSNFGASTTLWVKNDSANGAGAHNATLIKFSIPTDVDRSKIELAVLSLHGQPGSGSAVAQAFVYGCNSDSWQENTVDWDNAPGLAQDQPVGNLIRHGVAQEQGSTLKLVGQITVEGTTATERQVDVTEFIKTQPIGDNLVSFLLVQDPRRDSPYDSAGNAIGDVQGGLKFVSKEGAASAGVDGPTLKIVRRQ